ncbi:E3 binding domain-containing protein [Nocardia sp. NPDC052278]|uniref:E3 binding domain-containing protein n=1 Tax=unclassified Nocardia TaxID=2637762 RepID=UPI0036AAE7E6
MPVAPGRVRASGYARRLARELGVDMSAVRGGGYPGSARTRRARVCHENVWTRAGLAGRRGDPT